jgi:hypothetical protein
MSDENMQLQPAEAAYASVVSNYLHNVLTPAKLARIINHATREQDILRSFMPFDAIAFTGVSGAMVAPILALKWQKGLLLVRKPNEKNHSSMLVEGMEVAKSYLIVDDLIASGDTARRIIAALKESHPLAKCVGAYTYNESYVYSAYHLQKRLFLTDSEMNMEPVEPEESVLKLDPPQDSSCGCGPLVPAPNVRRSFPSPDSDTDSPQYGSFVLKDTAPNVGVWFPNMTV